MKNIDNILELFSQRLKELMKEKNLNITKFADLVNIPRTTVNSWTLGLKFPRLDYLWKIADEFGVTIDYLVGREE